MPIFVEGITGQECAALAPGNKCILVIFKLQDELGATVLPDGTCGILDGGECAAFKSREDISKLFQKLPNYFAPPSIGEDEG